MPETPRRIASAVALLAIAAGACRGVDPEPSGQVDRGTAPVQPEPVEVEEPWGPPPFLVAQAAVDGVRAFRHPGADRAFASFERRGSWGEPRVFLVREQREDWLRVLLPMEPNGSEGWIRAADVEIQGHPYRIEVDLGARRLTVFQEDDVIVQERVAVGMPEAPTPTGRFFTTVLVKSNDPNGPYGRFAYGLSAYSEVFSEFAGGDGQVAIHGTNAPGLIGQAVSHGCVRLRNGALERLTEFLPLGTPVRITP